MSIYLAIMASMALALNFAAHPSRAVAQGYVGQQHTSRDSLILLATHTNNKSPSNREKHQKGVERRQTGINAKAKKEAKQKNKKTGGSKPAGGRNGNTPRPK